MADSLSSGGSKTSQDSETDFRDPLGAKDPLSLALEEESNDFEYEINLNRSESLEIDQAFAETSSRLAAMALEDDLETETKDLFVVVDNPEKHATAMEAYITFRVKTKTTRSNYDSSEFQVRRRYNDFLWLRQRLEETQASHLVPPLPEKHSLKRFDRFSQEFVRTRMSALQKFLQRIADHPVLSFNKNFETFLTAQQGEFQAAKKEGTGFMSRMADSFHNMSAAYMMKTRAPEFASMNEYIQTFGEKVGVLDRISQRILKEQYEFLNDLNEWGPIFTLWSNSEDRLNKALNAMAKSIEKCYLALQDATDATETHFTNPLREYMLYADAVKAVLRRRDALQMEYEMTLEEMNRKKEEKDQVLMSDQSLSFGTLLGKPPDQVKQDKMDKLDLHLKELSKQVEMLNDRAVCADSDLKADMDRWHKTKRKDMRQIFVGMADRQIKYYEKCLAAWEEAIPCIQRTDQPSDVDIIKEMTMTTESS